MTLFRYKPNKIKYLKNIKTLDEIHREKISKFDNQSTNLPEKKMELKDLKKELNDINNIYKTNPRKVNLKQRGNLIEKIKHMETEIRHIESNIDMLDYFEKTSDVLLKYYEIEDSMQRMTSEILPDEVNINELETQEAFDEATANVVITEPTIDTEFNDKLLKLNEISKKGKKVKKPVKKRKTMNEEVLKKSILSFLVTPIENTIDTNKKNTNNTSITEADIELITQDKATLKDAYLVLVDNDYVCDKVKVSPIRFCSNCNIEKTIKPDEGMLVCQKCGEIERIIMESEVPSHKDALNEKPKYPYKKINHLIEKLNQFQSKETTIIPSSVYTTIDEEIRKQLIKRHLMTPNDIKKILKKHRLNNYYEHMHQIFSKVTNTPPPILTREIEENIKTMFKQIQSPFKKYCPKGRSNFLNYSYVIHKIFLILNMKNHSKYFPLLKSREKLRTQDTIWKKICEELNWKFYSSE